MCTSNSARRNCNVDPEWTLSIACCQYVTIGKSGTEALGHAQSASRRTLAISKRELHAFIQVVTLCASQEASWAMTPSLECRKNTVRASPRALIHPTATSSRLACKPRSVRGRGQIIPSVSNRGQWTWFVRECRGLLRLLGGLWCCMRPNWTGMAWGFGETREFYSPIRGHRMVQRSTL